MSNKHKHFLIFSIAVGFLLVGAIVHSQINLSPATPQVEIGARFKSADIDGNGVLSQEEFGKYLNVLRVETKPGKVCAKTGGACSHSGGDSASAAGCCKEKDKVQTVAVSAVTEKPAGGCCGGKKGEGKVQTVAVSAVTEKPAGGCCGGKKGEGKAEVSSEKADAQGKVTDAPSEITVSVNEP